MPWKRGSGGKPALGTGVAGFANEALVFGESDADDAEIALGIPQLQGNFGGVVIEDVGRGAVGDE